MKQQEDFDPSTPSPFFPPPDILLLPPDRRQCLYICTQTTGVPAEGYGGLTRKNASSVFWSVHVYKNTTGLAGVATSHISYRYKQETESN